MQAEQTDARADQYCRCNVRTAQLNAQAENAVANEEESLRAELNTAAQRAATAEERASNVVATSGAVQPTPRLPRRFSTEHNRAEVAEEEVREQRQENVSQSRQINVYLGEIANLKGEDP